MFYNSAKSKTSWRFEPLPPRWQARVSPLDYGFICIVVAKIVYLIVKEGGPTGPPPLGLKRIKYTLGPIGLNKDALIDHSELLANLSLFSPLAVHTCQKKFSSNLNSERLLTTCSHYYSWGHISWKYHQIWTKEIRKIAKFEFFY